MCKADVRKGLENVLAVRLPLSEPREIYKDKLETDNRSNIGSEFNFEIYLPGERDRSTIYRLNLIKLYRRKPELANLVMENSSEGIDSKTLYSVKLFMDFGFQEQIDVSRMVDTDILIQIWKNRVKKIDFVLKWLSGVGSEVGPTKETGNVRRRPGAGRSCATTSTDDQYIQLTARRNRTENATQLQRQLLLATGRRVSSQTVRNRLHEGWLYARRRMVCIPLTPRHRAARRRWAAEHRDWEQNDWSQVLFTDESRFSLECDSRHVLVWRDRGTRNNAAFVRERSQYRRAGWMVWGGISIGGRTDLHIIRNGPLTGRRYADEVLRPHVIPYAGAIGDSFVFQDDNAQPHRARLVENMLEAETIQRMEWPACSPDLNPIEHVLDMLGRHIAA
ncbi:transposable element Tcb2 transposase [Trichonephila clavipes]|nr:transposable element Tcb2 transposase [Trichonephila clavipes]